MSTSGQPTYRALPFKGKRYFGLLDSRVYRLYVSDDDLLSFDRAPGVSFSPGSRHKRFAFKDVQAIVITRTRAGMWMNAFLGVVGAALFLLAFLGVVWGGWNAYISFLLLGVPAAVFFILMAANVILGPTCKTQINTAVQAEYLVALSRWNKAREAIAVIEIMIEQAQGELTPEALETDVEQWTEAHASTRVHPARTFAQTLVRPPRATETKHEHGRFHAALFYVTLAFGVSPLIDTFFQSQYKNVIDTILLLPLTALIIICLIKQSRSDMPWRVKGITWSMLGVVVSTFIFTQIYSVIWSVSRAASLGPGQDALAEMVNTPVFFIFLLAWAAAHFILSILGLIGLARFRSEHEMMSAQEPTPSEAPPVESENGHGPSPTGGPDGA